MKMAVAVAGLLLPSPLLAADRSLPAEPGFDAAYARVLETSAHDSGVGYRQMKERPEALRAAVASLAALTPKQVAGWSRGEKIAFWINAYNVLTLDAVTSHYPIRSSRFSSFLYPKNSIRQIPGVWTKLRFEVAGRDVTLDEIENRILRERFKEPRIHVALVCASRGCPPLRSEPYRGPTLDAQLESQTSRFLADPSKFRLDRAQRTVWLSPIFKWFADDFHAEVPPELFPGKVDPLRGALRFVSLRLAGPERLFLESESYSVRYLDYDWALNEAP